MDEGLKGERLARLREIVESESALSPYGARMLLWEIDRLSALLEHYRGTCDECGREGVLVDGFGLNTSYTTVCAFDREECARLRDAARARLNAWYRSGTDEPFDPDDPRWVLREGR